MAVSLSTVPVLIIALIGLSQCVSLSRHVRAIEDQYNCRDARITNVEECRMIMANPILKQSYQQLQLTNHTDLGQAEREYLNQRQKRSTSDCPHMSDAYLAENFKQGLRSLSPYKTTPKYDRNRIPTFIYQASCLCEHGCIHPNTRVVTPSLNSIALKVRIDVYKSMVAGGPMVRTKENVTVGCTCVVPRVDSH